VSDEGTRPGSVQEGSTIDEEVKRRWVFAGGEWVLADDPMPVAVAALIQVVSELSERIKRLEEKVDHPMYILAIDPANPLSTSPSYPAKPKRKMNPPVPGHVLLNEGRFRKVSNDTLLGWHWEGGCECGAKPVGFPDVGVNETKRWHREHKERIRSGDDAQ
jgi:hypothetical protein